LDQEPAFWWRTVLDLLYVFGILFAVHVAVGPYLSRFPRLLISFLLVMGYFLFLRDKFFFT
jgi:hypothetical protein